MSVQSEGLVGVVERYLRKGSKVYIESQLRTRKWQDQSGNDRYTTEIVLNGPRAVLVMLDGAQGGGNRQSDDGWGGGAGSQGSGDYRRSEQERGGFGGQSSGSFDDDLDDEVPF